jgi:hypothetical protein
MTGAFTGAFMGGNTAFVLSSALLAGSLFMASPVAAASLETAAAVATITISHTDTGLMVKGGALAFSAGDYEAVMSIDKHGRSGTMKTKQAGRMSLAAGQSGSIAKVGLSYEPGDHVDIRLDVTAGGKAVSQARTTIE